MTKGSYEYDPESKEFKSRRQRPRWDEEGEELEMPEPEAEPRAAPLQEPVVPEPAISEPEELKAPSPEPGVEPGSPGPRTGPAQPRRRRRRQSGSYLPQEREEKKSDLGRRFMWVLIFVLMVAWLLMISKQINRAKYKGDRIFHLEKEDVVPDL